MTTRAADASVVEGLEPQALWQYFYELSQIPRGSGHEASVREYVCRLAAGAGIACKKDAAGNVCLYVPPTAGYEQSPTVVLQGHLDMVCEKSEDIIFNFSTSGIPLVRDGDWIQAKGTSLGADNGIGVAAGLAAAFSQRLTHGALEILLTVDEEAGLKGAMQLDPTLLNGKLLLNLDSEKTGAVCIGCAGGGRVTVRLPIYFTEIPRTYACLSVQLHGLRGGHSGLNIHENRSNAVKLLASLLAETRGVKSTLYALAGGDKINAIPRSAMAQICLPEPDMHAMRATIQERFDALAPCYPHETSLELSFADVNTPSQALPPVFFKRVFDLLQALPSGVLAMNPDIPGLVETSCNLASVRIKGAYLEIELMPRSSHSTGIQCVTAQIRAVAELAGGDCFTETPYPGWPVNLHSGLLRSVETVHDQLFSCKPRREATHAGLECGIIGHKYPGMDMVSIGPDIVDCHSPSEKVSIQSVQKFWFLLSGILEYIAKNGISDYNLK